MTEGRIIPIQTAQSIPTPPSDSIDAAALARLHDYMRREPAATEREADIASDAFVQGFRSGCRYIGRNTVQLTAIANPDFRLAIALLAEVLRMDSES